jgi:plastocyanin
VIEWLNNDSSRHRLVSDTQQFDSGDVDPDATANVVLTLPGRYSYHCAIHPRMVGLIIVP